MLEQWDLTERPQTAGGNSTEWHSVVGQDPWLLRTGIYTRTRPRRTSDTTRGTESLLHIPPPKWWRPRHHSWNLLLNLLLNLLPNRLSNPLSNFLLLISIDIHLSRSCLWDGIILPQVQRAVRICSRNSGDGSWVTGIFLVISVL